jgi:hypothetical protein
VWEYFPNTEEIDDIVEIIAVIGVMDEIGAEVDSETAEGRGSNSATDSVASFYYEMVGILISECSWCADTRNSCSDDDVWEWGVGGGTIGSAVGLIGYILSLREGKDD